MAMKPNYRMERMNRERQKAAKRAERTAAKAEKAAARQGPGEKAEEGSTPEVEPATETKG